MKYYLFPFHKVEPNSKIIVYGAGKVGMDYVRQIVKANYATLLYILDKDYARFSRLDYPVVSVDVLYSLNSNSYDYIVVAISDCHVFTNVKQELMSHGICESKIIGNVESPIRTVGVCRVNLCEFLNVPNSRNFAFDDYFNNAFGDISYFDSLIAELKAAGSDNEFRDCLEQSRNVKEKLVMLRMLYCASLFDSKDMRNYMLYIQKISNDIHSQYWLNNDATIMVFCNPSLLYDDFYLDRSSIFSGIVKELPLNNNGEMRFENMEKVVLLVPNLIDELASPTMLASKYASDLVKCGLDVFVYVLDSQRYDNTASFLVPFEIETTSSLLRNGRHKGLFDNKVNLVYVDGVNAVERVANCAKSIKNMSPYAIIDMTDELSPISFALKGVAPIVHLPMRGYVSSCFFDKYVTKNKELCIELNEKYRSISVEKMMELPLSFPVKNVRHVYNREFYGLSKKSFIVVTVGVRLASELDVPFIDEVVGLLRSNPLFVWIVVGNDVHEYLLECGVELISNKRIILWGYEQDLPALYRICDVYINPNRMGGGLSVIWAMQQGLPVVMCRHVCDIYTQFGPDNMFDCDYRGLMEVVRSLAMNSDLYEIHSNKMRMRSDMYSDTHLMIDRILDDVKLLKCNRGVE